PEGYRAVFVLIEVEGYSHKEVADMLRISVGTSKSQLFYAKKKLKSTLKEFGY
ncbi:MAG: RNA polymerase sigma factor, partial [Saprospiraceae bacterium]|nr:RNA polymerase sigma factor [Saprospiraceae bacterium]